MTLAQLRDHAKQAGNIVAFLALGCCLALAIVATLAWEYAQITVAWVAHRMRRRSSDER